MADRRVLRAAVLRATAMWTTSTVLLLALTGLGLALIAALLATSCAPIEAVVRLAPVATGFKTTASDGEADEEFGQSVALSGDYAVVGAWLDDDNGTSAGSAYIFARSTGNAWIEQVKLLPLDGDFNDFFGWSAAIDGSLVIIGAFGDDEATGSDLAGSAYVFAHDGTNWSQETKLTASDAAGDFFGYSVDIDGDYAIVGAYGDGDHGSNSGAAYIFTRGIDGVWSEQVKLYASDAGAGDHFGQSVGVDGDHAIIGAWKDDDHGSNAGAAYVFVRTGATWTQQAKLTADDGAAGNAFGISVATSGARAVVGANWADLPLDRTRAGAAYLFERQPDDMWFQTAKLTAGDAAAQDEFGTSVAISGRQIVVGAWLDDDSGSGSGSAYVFGDDGSGWSEQLKITARDGAIGDAFGWSVGLDRDYAVVGAYRDDDNGFNSGSAYVFQLPPVVCPDFVDPTGVDEADVLAAASHWNLRDDDPAWTSAEAFDLNSDGRIGADDITRVARAIGTCSR